MIVWGANCPDADSLGGYIDGTLSDGEMQIVREHVEQCRACTIVVHTAIAARDAMDRDIEEEGGCDGEEEG